MKMKSIFFGALFSGITFVAFGHDECKCDECGQIHSTQAKGGDESSENVSKDCLKPLSSDELISSDQYTVYLDDSFEIGGMMINESTETIVTKSNQGCNESHLVLGYLVVFSECNEEAIYTIRTWADDRSNKFSVTPNMDFQAESGYYTETTSTERTQDGYLMCEIRGAFQLQMSQENRQPYFGEIKMD